MERPVTRVSLSDLSAAGVRLHPAEAATIVHELALKVSRGEIPGVPSSHVIRISSDGTLSVEGPVVAGGRPVARAAQLLDSLLPGFDAPHDLHVPGALRLVAARALGTLDLPPYPSLESFANALARFVDPDPAGALRRLVVTLPAEPAEPQALVPPPPAVEKEPPARELTFRADAAALTISDIRRARRATGLSLTEVSDLSRIPAPLLRQLEWGYLRHWPAGHYGRTQLIRYARAAGLDEQLVVSTVWPMLQDTWQEGASGAEGAARSLPVRDGELVVEDVTPEFVPSVTAPRRRWSSWTLAALAVPALLVIGLSPIAWRVLHSPGAAGSGEPVGAVAVAQPSGAVLPATPRAATPSPADPTSVTAGSSHADVGAAASPPDVTSAASRRPAALPADAVAFSPSFASTGSAMFYHAEADGRSSLLRADTGTGGEILKITTVVDDRANNFHARPSPDGTRVAFDSDRDGVRGVYIADSTGHNVRKMSGEGFAAVPSWSPDGERLAFVRAEPNKPRVWNLWMADLASGKMRRLTSHPYGQPWGGSWFPDGRQIAYSHENDLIVLDLDTGAQRVYHSPRPGRLLRTPAVSPDGKRIIFQVYHDGAWILELADASMRKVLSDPSAEEYSWSPDGRRVAFHSRQSGEWGVWLMAAR